MRCTTKVRENKYVLHSLARPKGYVAPLRSFAAHCLAMNGLAHMMHLAVPGLRFEHNPTAPGSSPEVKGSPHAIYEICISVVPEAPAEPTYKINLPPPGAEETPKKEKKFGFF